MKVVLEQRYLVLEMIVPIVYFLFKSTTDLLKLLHVHFSHFPTFKKKHNVLSYKKCIFAFSFQFTRQISFGSAQTGSVTQAKKLFEMKKCDQNSSQIFGQNCDEEVENLTNNHQQQQYTNPSYRPQASPFRPLQYPTGTPLNPPLTRVTPLSMRRRSPSPVVTGNVSRARMRFESGGSTTR